MADLPGKPDIARLTIPSASVVHCVLPPWREEEVVSVSAPGFVGVAFTAQSAAVVRRGNGRAEQREVCVNAVEVGGDEPVSWIDVGSPSDIVEITGSAGMRGEIAEELGVAEHAGLANLSNWGDPVIHAIALRFRAGLRGWQPLETLEADDLVRAAYVRVLQRKFGGRPRAVGRLDAERLRRVTEYVANNIHLDLTLAELSSAAALSPYHFARSFRRATGLAPHRFVTMLRLEWAAGRLRQSLQPVEDIAAELGYSNFSHFRRQFRAQYGTSPAALRG
jgi:AraC family transcriptional regulator